MSKYASGYATRKLEILKCQFLESLHAPYHNLQASFNPVCPQPAPVTDSGPVQTLAHYTPATLVSSQLAGHCTLFCISRSLPTPAAPRSRKAVPQTLCVHSPFYFGLQLEQQALEKLFPDHT